MAKSFEEIRDIRAAGADAWDSVAYEDTGAEMVYRHGLRDGRREAASVVLAWLRDPARKPAHLAFTAGPERELADEIEEALAKANQGFTKTKEE